LRAKAVQILRTRNEVFIKNSNGGNLGDPGAIVILNDTLGADCAVNAAGSLADVGVEHALVERLLFDLTHGVLTQL